LEPIEKSLKSEKQIAVARLQDLAMDSILSIDKGIILHGGTAIWRCFSGKRFSFDLDLYGSERQLKKLLNGLTWEFSKRGITMNYPVSTSRVIDIHDVNASVKLEILKKPAGKKSVQKEYVKTDGTKMLINTLSEEDFITEKMKAYKSRGYARDLYDIYHLISSSERLGQKTKKKLKAFLKSATPPKDEKQLKELIYEGVAPTFDTIINYIKDAIK
jgi:predicted nucleotidyltransferase component of viral defense system